MRTTANLSSPSQPFWLCVVFALLASVSPASAKCLPMVQQAPRVIPAALPAPETVRLTYLGHSSFLIETAGGVSAVTDYNGWIKPPFAPDIVTMNNAHDTHYTDFPDEAIKMVLRGWDPDGGMAVHDRKVTDLRVWNVPTNVRSYSGTRYNGNSIFVFEAADLCIGHLGHLHHKLTDEHLGQLGLIDVLLVPVDGAYTIAQELMLEVLGQIDASLVIPMHYFGPETLARFLHLVEGRYDVIYSETSVVTLEQGKIPYRKVLVLPEGQRMIPSYD